MPFGAVTLVPGVNVEKTPTALRAGFSKSSLIRFRDSLVQKGGGWQKFYGSAIPGVPRDLHAWEDLNQVKHLAVATTTALDVITSGSVLDITPETIVSVGTQGFRTTAGSAVVSISDNNITNPTTFDSVFFDTPISIGGIILDGLYQLYIITGPNSYQIIAGTKATSNSSSAALPQFTTVNGQSIVSVLFPNHGLSFGDTIVFPIPTIANGVTILGAYKATSVTDANNFAIQASTAATSSGMFSMNVQNGSNPQLVYYLNLGPQPSGGGFGIGLFGTGEFGLGTILTPPATGTKITATDWTTDNWGQILLACPAGGGIYEWDPTGGFANAALIPQAPLFNSGMFVSTTLQIVVTYGSTIHQAVGYQQQPMLVQWCDQGDFTDWVPTATNQAGNYTIPIGSQIMGGLAVLNQNLIWTDLDLWSMFYIGPPDVFGFNKIGAGMGMASRHAAQQLRGSIFWMAPTNFCVYSGGGASILPCPVWDAVFQNINTAYIQNVRAMPNTPFNEAGWLYPSAASVSGECDSYVKVNVTEPGAPWDIGPLPRSTWIDQMVFGMPIAASPSGFIYQQETTPDADGSPLTASFTTGEFYLEEGEEFVFVDQVIPDFKWTVYPGGTSASIQISFNVTNFPGDTPIVYGPYTVTSATEYISVRFRGRLMSITVLSSDLGSFWRLGSIKYRYSRTGRR